MKTRLNSSGSVDYEVSSQADIDEACEAFRKLVQEGLLIDNRNYTLFLNFIAHEVIEDDE